MTRRLLLRAGVLLPLAGCSRQETARVVSRFGQAVRIRLNGKDTTPAVPPHGEAVLDGKHYLGGGDVRVTVLSLRGVVLAEGRADVPGDSAFRREAVVTVAPP